jgi:hypothetical protein
MKKYRNGGGQLPTPSVPEPSPPAGTQIGEAGNKGTMNLHHSGTKSGGAKVKGK